MYTREPRSFAPDEPRPASRLDHCAALDRGALAGLVESGCVTVIGLDAVRERLGPRWEQRRGRFWQAVEHHLSRRLRPRDFFARIDEVDLLLVAGDSRDEALTASLNILRELLAFFLGEHDPADLRVETVTGLRDDLIVRSRVDPRTLQPPARPAIRLERPLPNWSSLAFVATDGRDIRVAFELERVLSLRSFAGAALRINPVLSEADTGIRLGPQWREQLGFADVLHVDLAALDLLAPLRANLDVHKLIAPVSLDTLFSSRGRAGVLERLSGGEAGGPTPLIEIIGVDGGTPRGRLGEAVAVMARCAHGVIARTGLTRAHQQALSDCQLSGLSLDCAPLAAEERRMLASLWTFAKAARDVGPISLALGLPTEAGCSLAAAVGVSHATVHEPFAPAVRPSDLEAHAA
jgi:hypothetical protein